MPRGESGPRGRGGAGPLRPGPPPRTRGRRQERSTHAGARVAARRRPGADAGGWRARVGDRVRPRVPRRGFDRRGREGRQPARHHPLRGARALRAVARRPHRDAPEGGRGVRAARHRVLHPRRRGGPEIQRRAPGDDQPNASGDGASVRHRAPLHAPRGGEGAKGGPEGAAPDLVGRVQRRRRVPQRPRRVRSRGEPAPHERRDRRPLPRRAVGFARGRRRDLQRRHGARRVRVHAAQAVAADGRGRDVRAARGRRVGRGERSSRPIRHHGGRRRSSGRVSQFRAAAAGGAGDGGARRVPDSDGPHRGRRVHPRLDPGTAGVRDGGPAG
mmetsp:Transcript_2538/g.9835  ORF Transcript_2538/g.9835 Transcript_2538/m.9835 type:complete len:329 (+) Transcript_2538:490-1476(+)